MKERAKSISSSIATTRNWTASCSTASWTCCTGCGATSSGTRSTATIIPCRPPPVGDTLAPWNHSDLAAAILQPYLSADNHWLVQHHGIFQGYYFWHHSGGDRFARERYRGHPMFERTAEFCEKWDQRSFDPSYDTLPFDAFEPMMRRLLARPPFGGAVA
jgi:predicted HD phosphohydrolase